MEKAYPPADVTQGACIDNIDFAGEKGWMYWEDGMISNSKTVQY